MDRYQQLLKALDSYGLIDLRDYWTAHSLVVPDSFKEDYIMRTFIVHGEPIKARNKKMAEKIYRIRKEK